MKTVDKCPSCGLEVVFEPSENKVLCPRCCKPVWRSERPLLRLLPLDVSQGLRMVDLAQGTTSIGRQSARSSATVQLAVHDGFMSKLHCRISVSRTADGIVALLCDAGSANGTYLDGKCLMVDESVELSEGSILRLGTTEFRVLFLNNLFNDR